MVFPYLFSNIAIRGLELKNRIIMAPMGTGFFEKGLVTSQAKEFYLARAKGGAGLIIVGAVYITWPETADLSSIGLFAHMKDDSAIAGWQELIRELHQYGTKVGIQIFHPGRQITLSSWGEQPVGPSPLASTVTNTIPRELTLDEIEGLVQLFSDSAKRAEESGFDLIEIHGAHGYLISSFVSPYSNKRQDNYGGTLENRARLALQIIKRIKEKVSPDIPVGIRFNGQDNIDGGFTLIEAKLLASFLEKSGIDFLDISAGIYGSYPSLVPMGEPQGCFIPLAEEIKKVVQLPIIGVGCIKEPEFANHLIQEGRVDLVALGRTLIVDPDWPKKAASGKSDDIRMCISCNQGCLDRIEESLLSSRPVSITCLLNPVVGKESKMIPVTTKKPKDILVIGGGPAGLTASRVAAQRGHRITLVEEKQDLGGQFRLAAMPPTKQDIKEAIAFMEREAKQAGVIIKAGQPYTENLLKNLKPKIVIVATGARPLIPSIPGIENEIIVTAHDILSGKAQAGKQVLIIGGGQVGLETADYLSLQGRIVQVVEMMDRFATGMGSVSWMNLRRRLVRQGVKLTKSCMFKEFSGGKVMVVRQGRQETIEGIDTIVLAVGAVPNNVFINEIKTYVREVYIIGDAAQPRNALAAIHEGAQLASSI